ncbi:16S rRNA (cytidine(1402)-2'-O)-methyltransferase [Candidatus Poribacteria bacterium]|nr:16S rRNA (cytidine(1402)-2'-O)-methyltransferase [Candidatus Poribacteria bacterium]
MKMAQPTDVKSTEGILYIVSTPIGNLEDITLRALRTLKEVDLIAAEDTRHTRRLLAHYEIGTPTTSYFEGNQIQKGEKLVARLKAGESIALVSDAGTPTISDPGYRLLIQCIEADIPIIPIPGPSACIAAASIAGLPLHNFVFEGFLSPKSGRRKRQLTELREEKRTLIFYESPHRIVAFMQDVLEVFGDRRVSIARELTKKFEEVVRCTVTEAIQKFQETSPRGEFTIVIEGFLSSKE